MKKTISILLLLAMLASLSACGMNDSGNDTDTSAATENVDPNAETRTPSNVPAGVTFDGASYHSGFLYADDGTGYRQGEDLYFSDELSSDNMEAALYRRQKKVEQELDVVLSRNNDLSLGDFTILFNSGDDIYQEIHFPHTLFADIFSSSGYLYDVDALPYADYTAEWYKEDQMEGLRMGKKRYFIISDYMISNPGVILVNKDLVEDNNLDDPYALVNNGTWTIDRMIEMALAVRNDRNGDGSYITEDDIFGVQVGDIFDTAPLLAGTGQMLGARNPDTGKYEMTMNNEFTIDVLNKLYRLYENPGAINHEIVDFDRGNSLFSLTYADKIEYAASINEFEVGVIPFPKYSEEQAQYYSKDLSTLLGIPSTIKNPEMVGAVVEMLAWESGNEVIDTYYNKLLKTRYVSDLETRAMVELIFDTVVYDPLGYYFGGENGFCGLFYVAKNVLFDGQVHHAAFFRREAALCKKTLEKFYTELEKVEGVIEVETSEK